MYGTEGKVGQALTSWMASSGTAREQMFVTSKVWRGMSDVHGACKASLERLQLEYLDLYLIHTPVTFMSWVEEKDRDAAQRELWAAMESLVEQGLAKAIGVSNFSAEELATLLTYAKIKPAVNQVEHHPFCQAGTGRDGSRLRDLCSSHGIILEAYSPLAPLKDTSSGLLQLTESLAAAKGVGAPQILLRWGLDHGAAVVTTSTKCERIQGMSACFDEACTLTTDELAAMDAEGMVKRYRGYWGEEFGDCYEEEGKL